MTADNSLGIYIHIPFCLRKCLYCDFYSLPKTEQAEAYFDALKRNMQLLLGGKDKKNIDSIYIGGGTPSCIDGKYISETLDYLSKLSNIKDNAEISIECNPATLSRQKLSEYKSGGINRISIGMQSAVDSELKLLGRLHNFEEFKESYSLARDCGFSNLNVDIMTGIPSESVESAEYTLEKVKELSPEHISVYMLKLEKGTPLFINREKYSFPDEDEVCDIYYSTDKNLTKSGYTHYEISNFAKPGFECRHNIRYWECGEYIGFGAAAHSYYGGIRYSYKRDASAYINSDDFSDVIDEYNVINTSESEEEKLIFGLRLSKGLPLSFFKNKETIDKINDFARNGYFKLGGGNAALTVKGMLVSNYLISDLLLTEKK